MTLYSYIYIHIYICYIMFHSVCVCILYIAVYHPPSGPSCPDRTCVPGARAVPLAELLASKMRRTSCFWVSHMHLSHFHQNFRSAPLLILFLSPTNIIKLINLGAASILSWFCPLCQARPKIRMIDHLQTTHRCHPDLNVLHRRGCMSLGRLCLSPQPAEAGGLQCNFSVVSIC